MKDVLQHLVRMQELEYVLLEQEGFEDPTTMSQVRDQILALRSELPDAVGRLYDGLKQRRPPAVVVALNGKCSGCSMRMPTAQQEAVRIMESIERCQGCSRILYHPEIASRQLKRIPTEERRGIEGLTFVELMHPSLEATTMADAITELVQGMARSELIDRPDELVESALRRESLAPTTLGSGLAIPHVRGVEGGGLVFSLGLKRDGLANDQSPDDPIRIVFFFIVPTAAGDSFLELLAGLVSVFRERPARERLLECETSTDLFSALTDLTHEVFD